jgi:hypothetical protein
MSIELIRIELNDGIWSRWMTMKEFQANYADGSYRALEVDNWTEKEWQAYCNAAMK